MDRLNYYFRQKVSELELDEGFTNAENADHAIMTDQATIGVLQGAVVTQKAGGANLTVDITAGIISDKLGQRIRFTATQNVNCAVDENNVSTTVAGGGNSKKLSVFAKLKRTLSDPRTDGNSQNVFFVEDESFEFRVRQSAESGSPTLPPLDSTFILVADITLIFGQTQILNADISITRREDAYVYTTGGARSFRRGLVLDVFKDLLDYYNNHVGGSADQHGATSLNYAGGAAWVDATTNPATTVELQLDKIINDLISQAGAGGSGKIGSPSFVIGSVTIPNTSILGQLQTMVQSANSNYAGGGTWADSTTNPQTSVELQLDKIISELASTSGSGVHKIGAAAISGTTVTISAGNLRSQLVDLVSSAKHDVIGIGAWFDGTTNPNTNVQAQIVKIVADLIDSVGTDSGAHKIGCGARTNWLGGRTNPAAVSVFAAIDKIITDLATTTTADDGAERIGAQANGNLSAGSVRSQLDELDNEKAKQCDIQIFTGSSTWTKPTGTPAPQSVHVFAVGGGGGGGSGRKGATGTVRFGGGGGGGGGRSANWFRAVDLSATETVTIGQGGNGGASQATNSTNGNGGGTASATTFTRGGSVAFRAGGGGLGGGGTTGTGVGGSAGNGDIDGGAGGSGDDLVGVAGGNAAGAGGGGGGGGLDAANTERAGGTGGGLSSSYNFSVGGTAGTAGGGTGGTGGSVATNVPNGGAGGGGGGSENAGAAGAGGGGGNYGGGGGGGGASQDSAGNSGAGGNGADGICVVITYF